MNMRALRMRGSEREGVTGCCEKFAQSIVTCSLRQAVVRVIKLRKAMCVWNV
jgi:hypothetical protein